MYIAALLLTFLSLLFSQLPSLSSHAQSACPKRVNGDANCDNIINLNDFEVWRKEFSGTLTTTTSDFNNNQKVTIADFEIWRNGYFQPSTTITGATPTTGTSPSGQAMPVGDLPGWKQIFTDDFTTDVPVGSFPGTAYKSKWEVYLDGWPDTAGKMGKPSRYYPSKVISVKNGVLNKWLHTESGTPMGAAILPILPGHTSNRQGQLYGKYTVRFKGDALKGFKTAWLLWPDVGGNLQYGEVDFPEGDLASTIHAYMHRINASSGSDQDAFSTTATYTSWHTASIEWTASKITFILDGKIIGTSTSRIPNTKMHWVLQTESCLNTCPSPSLSGNVQIDWVAVYAPK